MEESPYALSTLTTDAHSGGGTGNHTCRRFSWTTNNNNAAAAANNVVAAAAAVGLHPVAANSLNAFRPPSFHIACDQQVALSSSPPLLHDAAAAILLADDPTSGSAVDDPHLHHQHSHDVIVDDDVTPESVDLLRMLPETQRTPKEINPRRTRCAYLQRDNDDDAEDSGGGGCDDGVLFYNSLRCASEYSNREQEERIAFLSRSYSTLDKTKRNNGPSATGNNGAGGGGCGGIYSDMEQAARSPNIAEYCTSKAHSRSCGSLTYPPPQRAVDKNRLNRSSRNVYTDSKGLKHKRLKRLKRCVFLGAIFLGIVLATTGIIVAFLVYAPFHMKAHTCRNGYIFCGKTGCVTPRRLCGSRLECPGVSSEVLCRGNKSDHSKDFIYSEGLPVTLNPLLREGTLLFGKDVSGWVYFQGGSSNGSRYITVHRAMTFYGAQESCRDQGGHLAHVNTVREQVFLEDYLNQIYKRHRFPADMLGFWVGARRARGSHAGSCLYNQWQWMDTYGRAHGTVTGFTAFATGKPDNFFAPEECLYLSTTHSHDEARYLKWDDAPCDIHGIGTIYAACEVELR